MKNLLFLILIFFISLKLAGQQNYCDFEGNKAIYFGGSTGVLDSVINPAPSGINNSAHCAKYIRDTAFYDYIKFYPITKLKDVTAYADNLFEAPKITMKLYSSAPVGTIVEVQLGLKNVDNYPAGVHSEYWAATTAQNAWQNLLFNFSQIPVGSLASPSNIDKIILLFHPASNSRDTIYFDDLAGPQLINAGVAILDDLAPFKLYQNYPNPSKEHTHIKFQLNETGYASIKIYDLLGNLISTLLDQNMSAGFYSIPMETRNFSDGIYFYVLKSGGNSKSMKMIISK